jgi:polysaccharide pyruvyl transferase WcaK-like protein
VIDHFTKSLFNAPTPVKSNILNLTIENWQGNKVDDLECGESYTIVINISELKISEGLFLAFSFVNLESKFSYRIETDKFKTIKGRLDRQSFRVYFNELNLPRGNYTIRFAISDGTYLNRIHQDDETIFFRVKDSLSAPKFIRGEWSKESFEENKKIGLIGWWGGMNEGDRFILETLERAFGKNFITCPIETPFEINQKTVEQLNRLDFIVVGGGGLFTLSPPMPFDTYPDWKSQIKTPFGFLGVGVQEINPKFESTVKEIVEDSNFFLVRDSGSLGQVQRFSSKVKQIPDLTFLYPRKIVRNADATKIGVNLRIWNFDEHRTYDNEAWCDAINALPGGKVTIPLSFLDGVKDADAMVHVDGMQNTAFDLDNYESIRIMVGMRLHSLIFAAQNGIPIIGVAYTPKVRRFFKDVGLEEFCLDVGEFWRLNELYCEASKREKEISEKLLKYTEAANKVVANDVQRIRNDLESS